MALLSAQNFFFLQMSDPQFGMYADNRNFAQETANFEFAIATANRLHPAFVVVCGDLVNRSGDAAQIAEYRRIAAKLDPAIRLYNVAGNHDVGNRPTPASLAAYRRNFGPDYYTFRHGGFEGFVLDSSLIQQPQDASEDAARQRQWLKLELKKAAGSGVHWRVVFQHIPWFLESPGEPDQYFNIPRGVRAGYLELFRQSAVEYVFAGHYHRNSYGNTPSLHVIATGPVGKPLGPDPSGIRVVTVTASRIESRYYGLGNIPNQIDPAAPQNPGN
ncbi:MAG: metallophosphoesterase [Bryobacteraceae bacterium]